MPRLIAALALLPLAACGHPADDERAEAKALIASHCATCHIVPGVKAAVGRVGPPLAGIARQQIIAGHYENTPANLRRWIAHPQEMRPGTAMPDMALTPRQVKIISDYLYTLDS